MPSWRAMNDHKQERNVLIVGNVSQPGATRDGTKWVQTTTTEARWGFQIQAQQTESVVRFESPQYRQQVPTEDLRALEMARRMRVRWGRVPKRDASTLQKGAVGDVGIHRQRWPDIDEAELSIDIHFIVRDKKYCGKKFRRRLVTSVDTDKRTIVLPDMSTEEIAARGPGWCR